MQRDAELKSANQGMAGIAARNDQHHGFWSNMSNTTSPKYVVHWMLQQPWIWYNSIRQLCLRGGVPMTLSLQVPTAGIAGRKLTLPGNRWKLPTHPGIQGHSGLMQ